MYFKEPYKTQLVGALRSGEYEQNTFGFLRYENAYCCLGVVCDLMPEDKKSWNIHEIVFKENEDPDVVYKFGILGASPYVLPLEVIDKVFEKPHETKLDVGQFTFDQDKKIIEKYSEHNGYIKYIRNQKAEDSEDETRLTLASMNDHGVPFSLISDIIEEFC